VNRIFFNCLEKFKHFINSAVQTDAFPDCWFH